MNIAKADIVKSIAGRDQGDLFFVLRTEGDFLYLADGDKRRCEAPKKKRLKHAVFFSKSDETIAAKIRSDQIITNSELRKAIAAYRGGNQNQED